MNIERFNADFGNSTNNFTIDGFYVEIPTNVAEFTQKQAEQHFVGKIDNVDQLLKRMMISTEVNGNVHYYLVGEEAERTKSSNAHVSRMHDKLTSAIPYASFLSAVAYYYCFFKDEVNDSNEIIIENMKMMLPVWLLTKTDKFSTAQRMMEQRFIGEHVVMVLTPGMERKIKITVKRAKCRIESEVARHAIKYRSVYKSDGSLVIEERKEASRFQGKQVVLVDIGGGSTDAVLLGESLSNPKNRNAFKVIDADPFLGYLEEFRKQKLLGVIGNLRVLERLIFKNYKEQRYEFTNENTGESIDLTEKITSALAEYANTLVPEVLNAFVPESEDEVYAFIYFGGEAPILQPYIKASLVEKISRQAADRNHYFLDEFMIIDNNEAFPPESRTLNIAALEILSLNEVAKSTK